MTKLVIDIDDKIYKDIKDGYTCPEYADEIINLIPDAIVLPKGHGRLIDIDNDLYDLDRRVEYAPIIIGADKEADPGDGRVIH